MKPIFSVVAALAVIMPIGLDAEEKSPTDFFQKDYANVAKGQSTAHDDRRNEEDAPDSYQIDPGNSLRPTPEGLRSRKPFSSRPTHQTRDWDVEMGTLEEERHERYGR